MKFPARFILSFFVVISLLFAASLPALAQSVSPTPSQTAVNPYLNPNMEDNVPKNLHTFTQSFIIEALSSASCLLGGINAQNPKEQCLGVNPQDGKIGYVNQHGGAVGAMGGMVASLYTPTVTSNDYMSYLSNSFGGEKAYAANQVGGYGFSGLTPFINIWVTFRNIAYLVFILVFVIVGFAIMLRVKIDPRTVMTIQNQIPKIIIGILLVTFSYAIAGFLIDMMWTSTFLVINVFHQANPEISSGTATHEITNPPIGFVNAVVVPNGGNVINLGTEGAGAAKDAIQGMFMNSSITTNKPVINKDATRNGILAGAGTGAAIGAAVGIWGGPAVIPATLIGAGIGAGVGAIGGIIGGGGIDVGALMGNIVGWLISWIVSVLVFLVLTIAILIALFRLWFSLIQAYVFILLDVILAPFWVIIGLLPGQHNGFSSWLRDIVANLAVFPTAVAMLMMAKIFMVSGSYGQSFFAPLIGDPNGAAFMPIIGIGFILQTPAVVTMVRQALKAPNIPFTGIGQSVGAGFGIVSNTIRGGVGQYQQSHEAYMKPDPQTGGVTYEPRGYFRTFLGRFSK